ncbi:hypothetical protein [Pseudomonas monachiensis]|uniref:Lipoprotein n=1 Tax=Pseudomonas monachiensis TaxID=3060212 RepID=A0ABW9H7V8_9PSED
MKLIVGALAIALLAGCSTASDIRKNAPLLTLSSEKKAKNVAECIRDGWQSTSLIGGSVGGVLQSSGERYSVIAPDPESPWHVVDITPTPSGSTVAYHFFRTWQDPSTKVTSVVESCAR